MNTYDLDIISNSSVCKDTYKLVLNCPSDFISKFTPGQFIHIKIPGRNELILRRPISIHRVDDSSLTIIYKVLGKGTEQLATLETGTRLDILGPIGRGFPKGESFSSIALIGGGLGCAPLLSVPAYDSSKTYHAFLGFAGKDDMYMTRDMENLCDSCHVSTDDGSFGFHGNSVQMLKEFLRDNTVDAVYACGPAPMLRALKTLDKDIPVYVSLEERMGCGYGGCLTCVCATADNGYKRVCVDGPVFDTREVEL